MKYPAHIYAKALAEVVIDPKAESGEAVKNFIALLQKNGDEMHLRKIVEEAIRLINRKTGMRKVVIRSARPLGMSQNQLVHEFLERGDAIEERIDPDLVAGVKIIVDDERQFDGSLKGKIDKMFNNI